jgi:hypothetical protein
MRQPDRGERHLITMRIATESSIIVSHRRLRARAEAELETSLRLNPGVGREAVRLEAVSQFAELTRRYANEGSPSMSQAMAVAAAHLGMTFRDREYASSEAPRWLVHRVA